MDRRGYYRPLLSRIGFWPGLLTVGWLAAAWPAPAQPPAAGPSPSAAATSTASATPGVPPRPRLNERRQREPVVGDLEAQRRIDALPPEEREAFKRNLRTWRQMTPEERDAVRREVNDRTRAEVERAYQQSGLHLDKDQREVFGLRYRQERRKLERELQEKMEAERLRRLPGLVEGLKKEFAEKSVPAPTPALAPPLAPPPAAQTTPSVSVPAASSAQAR